MNHNHIIHLHAHILLLIILHDPDPIFVMEDIHVPLVDQIHIVIIIVITDLNHQEDKHMYIRLINIIIEIIIIVIHIEEIMKKRIRIINIIIKKEKGIEIQIIKVII